MMKNVLVIGMLAVSVLLTTACDPGGGKATGTVDLSSVSNLLASERHGLSAVGAKYLLTVSEPDGTIAFQQGGSFPVAKIIFSISAGTSRLIRVIVTDSSGTLVYYTGETVADLLPNTGNAITVDLQYAITVAPRTADVLLGDSLNLSASAADAAASPAFTWTLVEGPSYGTLTASGSTAKYTAPKVMPSAAKATIQAEYTDGNGRKNVGTAAITIQGRLFPPEILSVTPQAGQIGTLVTVDGTFFGSKDAGGSIEFASASGTVNVNAQSWSDSQVTMTVPPDLSPGVQYDVVVKTQGGTSKKTDATKFSVLKSVPNISALEPSEISTNQKVGFGLKVRGSGFFSFTNGSLVKFGDKSPSTVYMPPESGIPAYLIAVIQPSWITASGTVPVKVVNSDGGQSGTVNFKVLNGAVISLANPVIPPGIPRDGAFHDVSVEITNDGEAPVKITEASLTVNGGDFSFTQPTLGMTLQAKEKATLHWGVKAEIDTVAGAYPLSIIVKGKDLKTTTEVLIASEPKSDIITVLGTAVAELLTFNVPDVYRRPQPPQTDVQIAVTAQNIGDGNAGVVSLGFTYFTEAGVEVPGAFSYNVTQAPPSINAGGSGEFKATLKADTAVPGRYKVKAKLTYTSPDAGTQKTAEVFSVVFPVRQLTVTITPSITRINTGDGQQFTAVVKDGTTPMGAVTWSLPDGAETGTVTGTGLYTAPIKLPLNLPRIRVRAASTLDPNAYADTTFAVALGNLRDSYSVEINGGTLVGVQKILVNDVTDINNPILSVAGGVYTLSMNLVKKLSGDWKGVGLSVSDSEAYAKDLTFPDAWGSVPGPAGYITTAVVYAGTINQASTPVTLRWKNGGTASNYKFIFDVIDELPALYDSGAIDTQNGSDVTLTGVNLGDSPLASEGNTVSIGTLQIPEADIKTWSTFSGTSTVIFTVPAGARTGIMSMKVANYNAINSHKQVTIGRVVVLDVGTGNGYPDHEGAVYVRSSPGDKYLFYCGRSLTSGFAEMFALDLTLPGPVTQLSYAQGSRAIKFIHKDAAENFIYFDLGTKILRRPPSDLTTATEAYYTAPSPVSGIASTSQSLYWGVDKQVWKGSRDIGTPDATAYTAQGNVSSLPYGLLYVTTGSRLVTPAVNGASNELMSAPADQTVPPEVALSTLASTAALEPASTELWTDGSSVYFPWNDAATGGSIGPGIYSFPAGGGVPAILAPLPSATARVSGSVVTGASGSYLYFMYLDSGTSSAVLKRIKLQTSGAQPEDVAYNVKSGSVPYGIFATSNYVYYGCNNAAVCRSPVY